MEGGKTVYKSEEKAGSSSSPLSSCSFPSPPSPPVGINSWSLNSSKCHSSSSSFPPSPSPPTPPCSPLLTNNDANNNSSNNKNVNEDMLLNEIDRLKQENLRLRQQIKQEEEKIICHENSSSLLPSVSPSPPSVSPTCLFSHLERKMLSYTPSSHSDSPPSSSPLPSPHSPSSSFLLDGLRVYSSSYRSSCPSVDLSPSSSSSRKSEGEKNNEEKITGRNNSLSTRTQTPVGLTDDMFVTPIEEYNDKSANSENKNTQKYKNLKHINGQFDMNDKLDNKNIAKDKKQCSYSPLSSTVRPPLSPSLTPNNSSPLLFSASPSYNKTVTPFTKTKKNNNNNNKTTSNNNECYIEKKLCSIRNSIGTSSVCSSRYSSPRGTHFSHSSDSDKHIAADTHTHTNNNNDAFANIEYALKHSSNNSNSNNNSKKENIYENVEEGEEDSFITWCSILNACMLPHHPPSPPHSPRIRNYYSSSPISSSPPYLSCSPFSLSSVFSLCTGCHIVTDDTPQVRQAPVQSSYALKKGGIEENEINGKKEGASNMYTAENASRYKHNVHTPEKQDENNEGGGNDARNKLVRNGGGIGTIVRPELDTSAPSFDCCYTHSHTCLNNKTNQDKQKPLPHTVGYMCQKTDNVVILGRRLLYKSGEFHRLHLTDSGGIQFQPPLPHNFQLNVILLTPPSECAFMLGISPRAHDLARPSLEMISGFYFYTKNQTLFAQDGTVGVDFSAQELYIRRGSCLGISYNSQERQMHIMLDNQDVGVCRFNSGCVLPEDEYLPTMLFANQSCYIELL